MSEKKELNQEQLDIVNGGTDETTLPIDGVHAPTTGDNTVYNDGEQGSSNKQWHAEVIL